MGAIDVIHPLSGEFDPNLLWQATVVRYVSKNGSDANDGLTQYSPMLTIGAAITSLAALGGAGGSVVYIAGGVYVENVTLQSNTAGNEIHLVGDPTDLVFIQPAAGIGLAIDAAAAAGLTWTLRNINVRSTVAGSPAVRFSDGVGGNGWGVHAHGCAFAGAGAGSTEVVLLSEVTLVMFGGSVQSLAITGQDGLRLAVADTFLTLRGTLVLVADAVCVLLSNAAAALTTFDAVLTQTDGGTTDYVVEVAAGTVTLNIALVTAANGRALSVAAGAQAFVYSSRFLANADDANESLIRVEGADAELSAWDCTFVNAAGGSGHGLNVKTGSAAANLYDCTVKAGRNAVNVEDGGTVEAYDSTFVSEGETNHDAVRVVGDGVGPAPTAQFNCHGYCIVRLTAGDGDVIDVSAYGLAATSGLLDNVGGGAGTDLRIDANSFLQLEAHVEFSQGGLVFAAGASFRHNVMEDGLTIPLLGNLAAGTADLYGGGGAGVAYAAPRVYQTLACVFSTAPTGAGGNNTIKMSNIDQAYNVTFSMAIAGGYQLLQASAPFMLTPGDRLLLEIIVQAGNTSGIGYFVLRSQG